MKICANYLLALLTLTMIAGCNVVGVAANAVAGGETAPAMFTPAKRPTVVVAENYSNPGATEVNSEPLTRYISDDLAAHQVAPMIDPDKTYALKESQSTTWHAMTMAAVGRQVGAEQLIYIDMTQFNIETADASGLIRGRAQVRVRVIDCKTGGTLWPTEMSDGYFIAAETAYRDRSASSEATLRDELLRNLSTRISILFYKVKQD